MNKYLLDTNIFLRACDPNSSSYSLVKNAVNNIIQEGGECFITSQILIEFWVVATRPTNINGLGWTTLKTQSEINKILDQFSLLPETSEIFPIWFQLVKDYDIKGKRTHDIRLLAVMKSHNISHLLTFNPRDFITIPDMVIIHPQEVYA